MQLTIDRLKKQYGTKIAVDNFSFTLTNGVYGLLGANGAGKTTLMRMLCGVLNSTHGEIKFNDFDVKSENYRDVLGYLPQDFGYYPEFTAIEFLCYIASLKGIKKHKAKQKALHLLEDLSLLPFAKKKIKTFSGGMKQRLGIAQALLNDPKILILDEPTAGLDPKERVKFRNLISQLGKERIVLLSTHIVSDVENIAKTILVMKNGQLIHSGSLEDIIAPIQNKVFEFYVDDATAQELIKNYPIINIRQEKDSTFLRIIADKPPCEDVQPVTACLEDLYLYYFNEVIKDE